MIDLYFQTRLITRVSRSFLALLLIAGVAFTGIPFSGTAQPSPPPPFRPMQLPGLDNVYSVAGRFLSGSVPHTDEGFAALARLGVKTIISVDGATPDAAAAEKFGMRYVHLPFGYDGIPGTNAVQLVKAAQALPGPVYIHCHHGMHRGPAAVAVMCEGVAGWDAALADRWMRLAGTATNYTGLYRAAADFKMPSAAQLAAVSTNFPSHTPINSLAAIMVKVDEHWTSLKAARKTGFKALVNPPGTLPADAALQLQELLHEAHRTGAGAARGARFETALIQADQAATELHHALDQLGHTPGAGQESTAREAFDSTSKSCASCHRDFRD